MKRLATILLVLLVATACGEDDKSPAPAASGQKVTINVLAAASLAEVFPALVERFHDDHPNVTVAFSFGGSSALARQVLEGAPADVLATADEATMATAAARTDAPAIFARNRLTMVVEEGNPLRIAELADLDRPGVGFAVCADAVPCGRVAAALLARAGVRARPRTFEQDVKAVLTKVRLGEVDAGLVYATDAKVATKDTDEVTLPLAVDAAFEAVYPIAAITGAGRAARDWVRFVRSPEAVGVLRDAGFLEP